MSYIVNMSSKVVSMRFKPEQIERLAHFARRVGKTPSETGALLVEEALRRAEFAEIDFRDSPAGRRVYIQGSSLAVWEIVSLAKVYEMDIHKTADHLEWPVHRVKAALNYASAYPQEIRDALADNARFTKTIVAQILPQTEFLELDSDAATLA